MKNYPDMKAKIHPKYYSQAKVTCACGSTWTTGSTQPELKVELCSQCHPFFTGKAKLIDTAGRVDRFKARLEQSKKLSKDKQERATKREEKRAKLAKQPDKPTKVKKENPA